MKIRGSNLTKEDQDYVLRAYVHRFTKEHYPSWAKGVWLDNKPYPMQFASDQEWLENTLFITKKNGRLDMRYNYCTSTPTWPNNPELKKINTSHVLGQCMG